MELFADAGVADAVIFTEEGPLVRPQAQSPWIEYIERMGHPVPPPPLLAPVPERTPLEVLTATEEEVAAVYCRTTEKRDLVNRRLKRETSDALTLAKVELHSCMTSLGQRMRALQRLRQEFHEEPHRWHARIGLQVTQTRDAVLATDQRCLAVVLPPEPAVLPGIQRARPGGRVRRGQLLLPVPVQYPEPWPDEPKIVDDTATAEDQQCVLCYSRRIATLNVPCGHMYSCVTCAVQQRPTACATCRTPITTVIRAYK